MSSDRYIKIGNDEYEKLPDAVILGSKWLVDMWERLGRPNSPLTESGGKLMFAIIAMWEELYPEDSREWYEGRKEYRLGEMDIKEQVRKRTGRSLASYPYPVYLIMKRMFPLFQASRRDNCLKMVKKFPQLLMANKA